MIMSADGEPMRDLRQLVIDSFATWYIALGYIVVLSLITLHLFHGAWSAFTSLGVTIRIILKRLSWEPTSLLLFLC